MRRKPYDSRDGYRVWLSGEEIKQLIGTMYDRGGPMHRIAGRLGAECGLRRDEAVQVRPVDVAETSRGDPVVRIPEDHTKRDKYRETPAPQALADQIDMIPEFRDEIDVGDAVLDVTGKTANRWVKRAAEELYAETGDDGWLSVTYHDLRRSWGTRMLEAGVLPSVVMSHGGWEDWDTFREHYLGEFSPSALARERRKVEWLTGDTLQTDDVENHVTPAVPPAAQDGF